VLKDDAMRFAQLRERWLPIAFFGFLSVGAPCVAAGQTPDDRAALQARLEALQQQLLTLRAEAPKSSATDLEAAVAALQARVDDLSSQIKIVARQAEIEKEAAAERAKTAPQSAAGRGGFSLQSADGNFRLRVRGYVQADSRFFLADSEQRGVDSFVLRRVRPIFEATMYSLFDVRMMPDFGNGTTVLQDAYIDARFSPRFKIRAGKYKPPIGLERLQSATDITFVERALPTALVPNRDLGIMAHGDIIGGNVAYAAGVFNGVPDGGSADLDVQDGKEGVARIFAQPWRTRSHSVWQGLGFGVAASYGNQRGVSSASSGLPTFKTAGQTTFFGFRGDDPVLGPVLADGAHTRWSLQGHYYFGSHGVFVEQVQSSQRVKRGTSNATLDNSSWQVATTWVVTGEPPSYRGVAPRSPFDMKAGTFGAVELTARYSELHVDPATFPFYANGATSTRGASAWTVGCNWILNSGVKVMANYEQTRFDAVGSVQRRREQDLLTRLQFSF
jgi:phosphate-selective porin OprO/OprP